ncbi:Glycoside hydrolase [Ophiocordyceps camponoti-floridani]|uniref:Glycoside hydrolase n=1 Tax=Ophiocordyceps camponoti-floridani TaxID=2030778 RepID=A0A8H4VB72_9HYPO|nr:Glycoside hydrolase [Ophiocordyceps camponoti-floridani]
MFTTKMVVLAALASLAGQAAAFNSHRHLHRRMIGEHKAGATHWVTVYETQYTTVYDQEPTGAAKPEDKAVYAPEPAKPTSQPDKKPVHYKSEAPVKPPAPAYKAPAPAYKPPPPPAPAPQAPAPAPLPRPPPFRSSPRLRLSSLLVASYVPPVAPKPPSTGPSNPSGPSQGSSGSPFSGKRGLAYNKAGLANKFSGQCNGCTPWAYNWGSSPDGLSPDISYVPMMWGNKDDAVKNWHSDAQKALANGCKAMLSINEPDMASQANMSPQAAAEFHVRHMNPYGGKALIGSPAVTNSGQSGQGIEWLKAFVKACDALPDKCVVDFCVVHWYSPPEYSNTLFKHIKDAHDACGGKPVWLTEFGPVDAGGKPSNSPEFFKSVVPGLDAIPYLHAYAPFMCSADLLMSSPDEISLMGKAYAGLPS